MKLVIREPHYWGLSLEKNALNHKIKTLVFIGVLLWLTEKF